MSSKKIRSDKVTQFKDKTFKNIFLPKYKNKNSPFMRLFNRRTNNTAKLKARCGTHSIKLKDRNNNIRIYKRIFIQCKANVWGNNKNT